MEDVRPTQLRVEASSFCQLRCPSCPTTLGAIDAAIGRGFLKLDDFRKLVDLNPWVKQVELSNYGEVFLNPQLLQILEYAARKGVAIHIGNGANLNHAGDDVLKGLVEHRVRRMTCSIDGASQESYSKYRIRGDFEKVIANIERINRYKEAFGCEFPQLTWQFVVFGHNEHEIDLARDMAARLNMAFVAKLTWDPKFSPIRDAESVRKKTGWKATTRGEYRDVHGESYAASICRQLWDDPQINWDGKVIGCCRNFWGDFGGNAFTDGLTESLNNERIAYAREMLLGGKPPRDDVPCATCELYHAMRDTGRWMRRSDAASASPRQERPPPLPASAGGA